MGRLNKNQKRLLIVSHPILVGMFERLLNEYADILVIDRKIMWECLWEVLDDGEKE